VFSDTIELDPDRDLLRVRTHADATAFQAAVGSVVASATVDDVDFIVSPTFPNRNAYTFVLPEPSGKSLQLAGLAFVLALSRVRRHGRRAARGSAIRRPRLPASREWPGRATR